MLDFLKDIKSQFLTDNINGLLIVSVVLLIVIYGYVLLNIREEWYDAIRGYWHVDPDFAKLSGLTHGGLMINKFFALELVSDEKQIVSMLDDGDFSINIDWWLIPGFGKRKYYSMKVKTADIDKLGNFFDSDEMRKNIRIEIEDDILYLYCHDALYLKAFNYSPISKMLNDTNHQPEID
jgi:hypothetical protein